MSREADLKPGRYYVLRGAALVLDTNHYGSPPPGNTDHERFAREYAQELAKKSPGVRFDVIRSVGAFIADSVREIT